MRESRKTARHLFGLALILALGGLIAGMAQPGYSSDLRRSSNSTGQAKTKRSADSRLPLVASRSSSKRILIYGRSLDLFAGFNEQNTAEADGDTVTVADEATWAGMTTAQFAAFDAIVFGDPSCGEGTGTLATADATKSVWSRAITGPVYIQGTDPVYHGFPGGQTMIRDGIRFAASGTGTGLYVSLSCYFIDEAENTPVDFLKLIGDFKVSGGDCADEVTIVKPSHPAMEGLLDGDLSNWGCSVHEFITEFPSTFEVLTAAIRPSDGVPLPYVIASLPPANPVDDTTTFVTQQYRDFLGREPDADGLAYWTSQITQCGSDIRCIHEHRISVSAAFFIEREFQDTGYFVDRLYKASFGRQPDYAEFTADRGKVIGGPNLEISKQAFVDEWVQRAGFLAAYPTMLSNTEVVNKLFDSAGLTGSTYDAQRQHEIEVLNAGGSRALVLRDLIEIPDFKNIPDPNDPRYGDIKMTSQYNPAFVLMQYFGYLRRDIDQGGYDFWLDVVNNREPNNYRGMVCSFITSEEYQHRFGTTVTHTNADCAP